MQTKGTISILMVTIFLMIALNCEAATQHNNRNSILFDAMSPYEDLTEYALTNNKIGIKNILGSLHVSDPLLSAELSVVAVKQLDNNFKIIITAMKNTDYASIALYAVDSYKVLVDELDSHDLTIPIEIAKLDYVGFEIHALLKQEDVDWKMISEIVRQGSHQWNLIRSKISDEKLADVMDTSINGLISALESKNTDMLEFAAQVDLDLVDLLEEYFENNQQPSNNL